MFQNKTKKQFKIMNLVNKNAAHIYIDNNKCSWTMDPIKQFSVDDCGRTS